MNYKITLLVISLFLCLNIFGQNEKITLNKKESGTLNLVVEDISDSSAVLRWNRIGGFFDSFEEYDNFALEFGNWTLYDVDGHETYPSFTYSFEHQGEPMAAIIFTPSACDIDATEQMPPHSGIKFLADFNPKSSTIAADDWMISPQTMVWEGDSISFWVKAGFFTYPNEKFQVFISDTDTNIDSFVSISPIETTTAGWTKRVYEIPSSYHGKAIYVALHVTTLDQFVFCMDDFKIGAGDPIVSCSVSLDGEEIATDVTEDAYILTNLEADKTYTASILATTKSGNIIEDNVQFKTQSISVGEVLTNVVIAPNPTFGQLKVEASGTYLLRILNIFGKVMVEKTMQNNTTIDISRFSTGMYFVELSNKQALSTYKIIKR